MIFGAQNNHVCSCLYGCAHSPFNGLEYNPSIVHFQLNDYHITDHVISQIAVIINSLPKQLSLLDLSGSEVDYDTLRVFCEALDDKYTVTVNAVKFVSNKLTSLSLVAKAIYYLNPNTVDISGNRLTSDDSLNASTISIILADKLWMFDHDKELH